MERHALDGFILLERQSRSLVYMSAYLGISCRQGVVRDAKIVCRGKDRGAAFSALRGGYGLDDRICFRVQQVHLSGGRSVCGTIFYGCTAPDSADHGIGNRLYT